MHEYPLIKITRENQDKYKLLTRAQLRDYDRLSVEAGEITSLELMENAANHVVAAVLEMLNDARGANVVVLAGGGNNGGDGYAAGRILHLLGCNVIFCTSTGLERYQGDALVQVQRVQELGEVIHFLQSEKDLEILREKLLGADVVIDAMLGTGFEGDVGLRPMMEAMVKLVNSVAAGKIVSVDIPSGMDCDKYYPEIIAIRARVTVTFVALKRSLTDEKLRSYVGEIRLGMIGPDVDSVLKEWDGVG